MAEKVLREAINIDPTAFEAWLVFLIFYFRALLLFSVIDGCACQALSPLCHGSLFAMLINTMVSSRPMQSFC